MERKVSSEDMVKESLFQFIRGNIPNADLSIIDDIVLNYVISILDEASNDPYFELEGFIEVMGAYIPEIESINPSVVYAWFVDLEIALRRLKEEEEFDETPTQEGNGNEAAGVSLELQNISDIATCAPPRQNICQANSESSSDEEPERRVEELYPEQYEILHEMFPNTCAMEIRHCLSIANGDAEGAAATLLHRREQGQALTASGMHAAARNPVVCDDFELRNRIIARYSYVDQNADTREHRPLAPKVEPKKLVRYRDNKIVSLKGERYTEVPKSGIDEEHLKKPKKQHCP